MTSSIFPGPVPPYTNPPIKPQYFQPSIFNISNLSLGSATTVTTDVDHNYVIGQLVRLIIPRPFGSYQLNEKSGYVLSIPSSTSILTQIDSLNTDAFVASPTYYTTLPQVLAIGDVNSGAINSSGLLNQSTLIAGSFENISPL